jgi:diadenosine tetraphosphate (Ap4A) HIT family hydrolase
MHPFKLHRQLETDTAFVAEWALSRALLMDDSRFPWLVLVPRRVDVMEIHDLAHAERMVLIEEIARAAKGLKSLRGATKINVAALGNLVPQLHIHVVARMPNDAAWPAPVWGCGSRLPYSEVTRIALIEWLKTAL